MRRLKQQAILCWAARLRPFSIFLTKYHDLTLDLATGFAIIHLVLDLIGLISGVWIWPFLIYLWLALKKLPPFHTQDIIKDMWTLKEPLSSERCLSYTEQVIILFERQPRMNSPSLDFLPARGVAGQLPQRSKRISTFTIAVLATKGTVVTPV